MLISMRSNLLLLYQERLLAYHGICPLFVAAHACANRLYDLGFDFAITMVTTSVGVKTLVTDETVICGLLIKATLGMHDRLCVVYPS